MDATGQVYFDDEDKIPQEDKDRLAAAEAKQNKETLQRYLDRLVAERYDDGS